MLAFSTETREPKVVDVNANFVAIDDTVHVGSGGDAVLAGEFLGAILCNIGRVRCDGYAWIRYRLDPRRHPFLGLSCHVANSWALTKFWHTSVDVPYMCVILLPSLACPLALECGSGRRPDPHEWRF